MRAVHCYSLILTLLAVGPAAAQSPKPDSTQMPVPVEMTAVTHHSLTIDGKPIPYTATAGNLLVRSDSGEVVGSFFYVAYTKDGEEPRKRAVTFVFNGGPGSSSIWLHMGSFAPVRVNTANAGSTPPAPYDVKENPSSLIDKTDLVFVDAMATGFSRIVGKGDGKRFFGVDQDIRAFADFITRYVTVNNRWNSPKLLMGESYGTMRAAGLAAFLEGRGMPMNGLVLISSFLNAYLDYPGPAFSLEIPYALYLPTMAATAWYHDKLTPKPADLTGFLGQVKEFALGDYLHALNQGARLTDGERAAVIAKLHQFTGISEEFLRHANIRLTPDRFEKELLRGTRRTAGRLDARYLGIDRDAAGETPEYDAADAAIAGPFVSAFNSYLKNDLHYESNERYFPSNYPVVGADWDNHHRAEGQRYPLADVSVDLREAMSKNPNLMVFSANGLFDFATPFFETDYTLQHMGLDPSLEKNIVSGYYQSGHMIYLNPPSLVQLRKDLGAFYAAVVAR